jgi:hypothetical protein
VKAARLYHELLARDPSGAAAQAESLLEAFARAGVVFGGAPMSSFLRPHFVERADWEALTRASRRLLELSARVARAAFSGDVARLCAFLGTPEAEVPWVSLDPGPPDVMLSRLDAFLSPDGPRFIEINSDAPAGFGYGDRMAEVFQGLGVFREFAERCPVAYVASGPPLVEAVLAGGGAGPAPHVAIVDWADVKTRPDQELLREAFLRRGAACLLADPGEMSVRGGRLRVRDTPIDVVYRRGLLQELLEREAEASALLRACREGLARFVNSFRCRLSEDKAFFALLSDEAFSTLLSEDERAFVTRVVPWTRKVAERHTTRAGRTVDLVPHVLAEREGLVLKPAHGYGGQSVLVGAETAPSTWAEAVQAALGEPWVVQERVAIPEEDFPVLAEGCLRFEPRKVNVNPFYVRGAETGAVTRASRNSVINVSAGGGSVPTFVVG